MKKSMIEDWREALKSGNYRQGERMLFDEENGTYCCLGVLCEVAGTLDNIKDMCSYNIWQNGSTYPDEVNDLFGVNYQIPEYLGFLNDFGIPFAFIAIEISNLASGDFSNYDIWANRLGTGRSVADRILDNLGRVK